MNKKLLFLLTASIIFLVSCSSGLYNRGKLEIDAGNYPGAITAFKQALDNNPDRAELWQGLGIAYYKNAQYAEALDALKQAMLLGPADGLTTLYLGLSYERLGQLSDAAQLYRKYLSDKPSGEFSERISHRAKYLTDQAVREQVSQMISSEKSISTESLPENTVAVLGFNPGNLSPRYEPLARGLAELLVIDLSKIDDLQIVERIMLQAILDELELSKSEYFDKTKAPRVGKLIGASRVISGQLTQENNDELKLESGIIGVKDGFVDYPADVEGDLNKFFELEKQLARNIFDALGYKLTPEEEEQFMKLPTQSFLAFLSYSLGLEYMDQGMYSLAEAQFNDALKEDPGFALAQRAKSEVSGLSTYTGEVEPAGILEEALFEAYYAQQPGSPATGGSGIRQLQSTLGWQPDAAEDEGDNPHTEPVVGTGRVTVIGNFDE